MHNKLLAASIEDIGAKNTIKNFYPFSTKDDRVNRQFSFDEVLGNFISHVTRKQINSFDKNIFKDSCINKFEDLLDDTDYLSLIESIYFQDNELSLDSMFIYQTLKLSNNSSKIFDIFNGLIDNVDLDINFDSNVNFMEKVIIDQLKDQLKNKKNKEVTSSYLPFLKDLFIHDIKFISKNKHYFMQNIERFFELYLFIYCSQLALNLQPYFLEEPKSRELYFILNHEKVSNERSKIVANGYSNLYARAKYIFPYLSLLTVLSNLSKDNDLRFYELLEKIEDNSLSTKGIDTFHKTFREAKKLDTSLFNQVSSENLKDALTSLFSSSFEQFKENCVVDRKNALDKYTKAFEKQVAKPFIQSRGRAGKILVLDQDTIILLTNISIGAKDKLRFQDLLNEFEKRGIYFDSRSRIELINLFERIGNIERKSDSGDAVYVKTTI